MHKHTRTYSSTYIQVLCTRAFTYIMQAHMYVNDVRFKLKQAKTIQKAISKCIADACAMMLAYNAPNPALWHWNFQALTLKLSIRFKSLMMWPTLSIPIFSRKSVFSSSRSSPRRLCFLGRSRKLLRNNTRLGQHWFFGMKNFSVC